MQLLNVLCKFAQFLLYPEMLFPACLLLVLWNCRGYCVCRIVVDEGLWPVGRSWHSFSPASSHQLFLYGGYTNDQRPLGQ